MKKTLSVFGILVLLLMFATITGFAHTADAPLIVDLLAGQTEDIGDVNVWNDVDNLFVQFVSDECMIETHLHVATSLEVIPQTKKSNPIPGQFEYSTYHGCSTDYTYTIPLDSWSAGTPLYIAAHAALGTEQTMYFYSGDGTTMVTAGNVPEMSYPFSAVDAWEAFGDPDDSTPSTWDNRLTLNGSPFAFSMADWIWEAYRVVDPKVEQAVNFEHYFTIPGYPLSAKMYIATDNMYAVSLNDVFIGEQTVYQDWPKVGEYEIFPTEGLNTLQVVGTNYGNTGYTIDNNPAGLIFEGEINYLVSGDSAWADGLEFEGKNWATYFEYTVQKPPLVIGSWDAARGDLSAFASTDAFSSARAAIDAGYGATYDISYQQFNQLDGSLNAVDIAVFGSVKQNASGNPISELTAAEKTALYDYVQQGGCAILLTDGTSFNVENDSLTIPFGLSTTGGFSGQPLATITAGFTSVPTYKPNYPGFYATNGGYTTIATINGQVSGVMGTIGEGQFFAFSDINMFWNPADDIGGAYFDDNAQFFMDVFGECVD